MVNGCRYPVIQRSSERRGERRGFSSPKSRIFANIGYEGVVNTHQCLWTRWAGGRRVRLQVRFLSGTPVT